MTRLEIKETVVRFVRLIEEGAGNAAENERLLINVLDELALAAGTLEEIFDESVDGEPPRKEYKIDRQLVESRFPEFGHYNMVLNVIDKVGRPEFGTGDAIDDIADIYGEMKEVLWRWEHNSPDDALWWYKYFYRCHWGLHLRHLQLYLLEREAADEDRE